MLNPAPDATAFPPGGEPPPALCIPSGFIVLPGLQGDPLARRLGYFHTARYIIFGYSHEGGEVLWNDGRSSGFATGAWRVFLDELVPCAARHGVDLDGPEARGSHVLLVDRIDELVYAAPRRCAVEFIAKATGDPSPKRRCLCADQADQGMPPH